MSRKRDDDAGTLGIEMPSQGRLGPGPVYQGVAKEIRERIEAKTIDRDLDAGAIAAARSCARSVDHASGHNLPHGTVASGMQLAALHAQLLAWLDRLGGTGGVDDPLSRLAAQWEEDERRGRTPAPHLEV